jgi:uncharacterized FlaG/YvyC family protein
MAIELDITKKCGCVKKSGIEFPKTFETKEEALNEAKKLTEEFNETFCHKHNFSVEEDGDKVVIKVVEA